MYGVMKLKVILNCKIRGDSEEIMNHEELVSLIKGQRIHQILVANMYPDGDPCTDEILIEEIILENGVRISFEGSPRAEIKKGV